MNEIQATILQRLSRTRELNQTLLKLKEKHLDNIKEEQNHIIKYKNQENLRSFKETELLVHLQNKQFHTQNQLKEFYLISVQICSFYDSEYQIFLDQIDEFNMLHIQRLYVAFFAQHGIKRRSRQIASFLKKTYYDVNPAIYLGWMIQWSRIKYCETLDAIQTFYRQMKIVMNKQKRIHQRISHVQEQTKIQHKKEGNIPKRKIISLNVKLQNNRIDSGLTQQKQKQKKNIYLFNKDSVCSYFIEELSQYYRNLNLQDLDLNYVRCIKKQGKKQDLFVAQNMSKVLQFLLQNKNKEEKVSILKYENQFKKSKVGAKIIEESLKITQRKTQTQKNTPFKQKNQTQAKVSFTEYMNLTNSTKPTFIRLSKTHKFMKEKMSQRAIKGLQQIQQKSLPKDQQINNGLKQKQRSIKQKQRQKQRQKQKEKEKEALNTNYMIEFPLIQRLKKQKEDKIIISSQNNQKGKRRVKRQSILGDQFYVVPTHHASKSTKLPESLKNKVRQSDSNLINQQELFIQTRSFSKDSIAYYSSGKSHFIKNPEGSDKKQIKSNFKLNETKIQKRKESQKSLLYKILGHTPNFDDKEFVQNRKNAKQKNQKMNQQRQLAVLKKLRKKMQIKGVIIRQMNNLVIQ